MVVTTRPAWPETWRVAAAFIGTVVGAGFASGQEILKFFSHFGGPGILGISVSCLLFCAAGSMIMLLGRSLQAVSFAEVVRHVGGARLGPALDLLVGLFLFGTLSVMLAGAGAVFAQQWGGPYLAGTFFTLVISELTVLFGIKGIIKVNSIVVPVMLASCLLAALPGVSGQGLLAALTNFVPAGQGAAPNWFLSALLYTAYNITLGAAVLAPLGAKIRNRRILLAGGCLGGLGLGISAMAINLAILCHYPDSAQYEIPSLFVAGHLAWYGQILFSFILWAEIFTTIIGNLYGLAVRVSHYTGLNYPAVTVFLMLAALAISRLGFSGLVGTLYPLFGYLSLVFLVCLAVAPLRNRK